MLTDDIERTLLHTTTILSRIDELAADLSRDYEGKELTVIAVLNGSLMFMADLLRRMDMPLQLACISVASYHGGTETTGRVTFNQLEMPEVAGRHVLVVDDILDSGLTLHAICEKIRTESRPLSLKICVLLRKLKTRTEPMDADYVGFDIGDEFVVGYGLDYQERYRNLPFIGVLKKSLTA